MAKKRRKRKTRQEKKITELRRKLIAQKQEAKTSSPSKNTDKEGQKRAKLPPQKPIIQKDSFFQTFDKKEVKGDLLKTLILSALAISLEVVIYIIKRQA